MNNRPIIETNRLHLRHWQPSDASFLFHLNNDPEVIQYTGDKPFASIAAAEAFIIQYLPTYKNGLGRMAIILKGENQFIGWCGLKHISSLNEVDVGYRLAKAYWNKGYATEAAIASIRYGFEKLQLPKIIGRTMLLNKASIKVHEKCGMKKEAEVVFEEHPGIVYAAYKDEWLNNHIQ